MSPVRSRPILIAFLGTLAIAIAAATLNTAVRIDEGVGSPGDQAPGSGGGSGSGPGANSSMFSLSEIEPLYELPCYPFLVEPSFLLMAGAGLVVTAYALYRVFNPLVPVMLYAAFAAPALLAYLLLTRCVREPAGPAAQSSNGSFTIPLPPGNASTIGFFDGGGSGGQLPAMSLFILGVLLVALVAAIVMFVQSADDGGEDERSAEPPLPNDLRSAIGRAAGRAADRIENDVDADNAVYQAWREMTTHLDVDNPTASTPAEFAAAAVEAGMNPDDVSELTALFEDIRYGDAEVTDGRETRAVSALRRIEVEYTAGGR